MSEFKRDLLERALTKLQNGWCQGAYADKHGNYCAVGAISASYLELSPEVRETREIGEYGEAISVFTAQIGTHDIPTWNDDPDRTKEDVIEAFQKAIKDVIENS